MSARTRTQVATAIQNMGHSRTHRRSSEIAHLAPKIVEAYTNRLGSVKEIAKSLGVSYVWAYEKLSEAGIVPDWRLMGPPSAERQERDNSVVSLRDQNYSIPLICRLLDMSRSHVYSILKRYGRTDAQRKQKPSITQ